jgi:hypothetical protein
LLNKSFSSPPAFVVMLSSLLRTFFGGFTLSLFDEAESIGIDLFLLKESLMLLLLFSLL